MKLKISFFALFALLAFSCSDDPPQGPEDPINPPDEEEVLDDPESEIDLTEVMATMDDYFNSVETADPAVLKSLLEKVKNVKSVTDGNDGMLYLTMDNGREVRVSLEVVSSGPQQTDEEAKAQDAAIEELAKQFDVTDSETEGYMNIAGSLPGANALSSTAGNLPMSVFPDKQPLHKVYGIRDRILTRKKVLLFSPDPSLRSEDIKRMERAISRQAKYAGKVELVFHELSDYSPTYFREFSNYDIVVVGCHGTPKGEICLPKYAMTSTAIAQWERLARDPMSGVYAQPLTYEKGEIFHGKPLKERITTDGYALDSKFFATHLSNLENTIIWTVKCYSGKILAELRTGCIVLNDAAGYFGANGKCLGKEVYDIFDSYFFLLTQGKNSNEAFFETPDKDGKKNNFHKWLSGGFKYTTEETHMAYYLNVTATGVRRKPSSRAESKEKKADKVVVGLQFRYETDASGNPTSIGKGGVRLVNLETSEVTYVPVSETNIESENLVRVGDSFAIHEIDVALSDLRPGTRYLYNGYIEAESEILSEQAYEFTAEESAIEIYTEEDWNKAAEKIRSEPEEQADIKIMRDITLTNYKCFDFFNGTLDGNGHTITVVTDNIVGYYSYLIYNSSSSSLIHNLTINANYLSGLTLISTNWGTIDNVKFVLSEGNRSNDPSGNTIKMFSRNFGTISNCDFSGSCKDFVVCSDNYGTFTDCSLNLTPTGDTPSYIFKTNEDGGLLTRLKDYSNIKESFVEDNYGHISYCEFHGKYDIADGFYLPSIINSNYDSGSIQSCKSYATVDADSRVFSIVFSNYGTLEDIVNYSNNHIICLEARGGTITRCINRAKYVNNAHAGIVESVIGEHGSVTLSHCENYASIHNSIPNGHCISGIANAGSGNSVVIENCANYGDVYGCASAVSGIVSFPHSENLVITVRDCVNTGTLTLRNDIYDWTDGIMRMSQIAVKSERCTYYLSGNEEKGKCVREGRYADYIWIE